MSFHRYNKLLPGLVLALGLLATWFLQGAAMDAARRNQQDSFAYEANEIRLRIVQRLTAYEQVLHGLQGLYVASGTVERGAFHEYISTLRLEDHYPGIQGLGYALNIPAHERASHVDAVRAEGFPGYTLHPEGERERYTSVIYLEPFTGLNLRAFGYDMYAEEVRRAAMDQACDSNDLAMSGRVRLLMETGQDEQAGFLMYLPVYHKGSPHETLNQRRANISGWVYAIFRSGDLLRGVLADQIQNIAFEIYDGDSIAPATQLYDSASHQSHARPPLYKAVHRIEFGGNTWIIRMRSLPALEMNLNTWRANLIRVMGTLCSALLALLVWQLASGRAQALGLAEHMTKELRESERHFRAVTESANDAIIASDSAGHIVNWNAAAERMFGYTQGEVMGQSLALLMPARFHNRLKKVLAQMQAGEAARLMGGEMMEVYGMHNNGSEFPAEISFSPWTAEKERFFTAIVRDISARRRAEDALQASRQDMNLLLNSMVECAYGVDTQGNCTFVNRSFLKTMGYMSENEVLGRNMHGLIHHSRANGSPLTESDSKIYRAFLAHHTANVADEVFWRRDGTAIPVEYWANPILKGWEVAGAIVTFIDITERKQAEDAIHNLAFFDPLTQLPNRRLLLDRLHQALAVSTRSGRHGAVLFLDMDNFKAINDTKSHAVGDLLLIEVARRLQCCLREGDSVARLGGDEFVVILEELSNKPGEAASQARQVAEKIRDELSRSYSLGGYECNTSPSIGISLFQDHIEDAGELLKRADVAMYQAKQSGRNAIRFFDPDMQSALEKCAAVEADLRRALACQQLRLHYQIQVDSRGKAVGAEALLRCDHPENGIVFPDKFIPLAEETGLIVPIGLWVLQTACDQLKAWQNNALTRDLALAVNVSAKQFRQPDFVAQVRQVLLENVQDTIAKMHEILALGVSFSMDDFGTGYSSLQYLKRLPLSQVKIDRSFVSDITSDPDGAAIVQTIIAMTDALGLNVIAEGVETEAQRDFLIRHGCHVFQGYLFGKPAPVTELEAWLQAFDTMEAAKGDPGMPLADSIA